MIYWRCRIAAKRKSLEDFVMRGVFLVGFVVALLIVGVLVMKNMGTHSTGGDTGTRAEKFIEKAEGVAETVDQKAADIGRQVDDSE
jgi:hypothetical protein